MANPFSQATLANFNASPPPDDGTQVAANEVEWQKHVDKIGTPLKNYGDDTNTNISAAFDKLFLNNISDILVNYTVQITDQGKILNCENTITITLLAAATASSNFALVVRNNGSGTITIDGNASETINGDASISLSEGQAVALACNGTSWTAIGFTHGANAVTDDTTQNITGPKTFVSTSGGTAPVTVKSTDAGVNGPILIIQHDSASPAVSDIPGSIFFRGDDSAGNVEDYAKIDVVIDDPTSGSEDGRIRLRTTRGGTNTVRVTVADGVQVGSPTSGDKGAGTLNAAGQIYINNVPVVQETNGVGVTTVIQKTVDEGIGSSNVLQDDNHLTFSIAASERWIANFFLDAGAALATTGIKLAITVPTGATLNAIAVAEARNFRTTTSGAALDFTAAGFTDNDVLIHLSVYVENDSTAGSVTLQFAQSTSIATAVTLRKGSHMIAHRLL